MSLKQLLNITTDCLLLTIKVCSYNCRIEFVKVPFHGSSVVSSIAISSSTLDLPNHLHCPPMSINYKQVVVCPCMYPKITCSSLYLCCMRGLHHASLCIPNSYPTTSSSALLLATTGTPSYTLQLPCH
jgi:hypothetical protein